VLTTAQATAELIAQAKRYVGVTEDPKGSNRGVCVDYWIRECGLDPKGGFAWCAAFAGQMGRQALGDAWPVPRSASVAAIVAWASAKTGVLLDSPVAGDLIFFWHADLKRYAHIGIVTAVGTAGAVSTIEGNTAPDGGREGWGVMVKQRKAGPGVKFGRWTAVLTPGG
jgi:hypothetical protein